MERIINVSDSDTPSNQTPVNQRAKMQVTTNLAAAIAQHDGKNPAESMEFALTPTLPKNQQS